MEFCAKIDKYAGIDLITRWDEAPMISINRNPKVPAKVHGVYRIDGLRHSDIETSIKADFAQHGFAVNVFLGPIDADDAKAIVTVAIKP